MLTTFVGVSLLQINNSTVHIMPVHVIPYCLYESTGYHTFTSIGIASEKHRKTIVPSCCLWQLTSAFETAYWMARYSLDGTNWSDLVSMDLALHLYQTSLHNCMYVMAYTCRKDPIMRHAMQCTSSYNHGDGKTF